MTTDASKRDGDELATVVANVDRIVQRCKQRRWAGGLREASDVLALLSEFASQALESADHRFEVNQYRFDHTPDPAMPLLPLPQDYRALEEAANAAALRSGLALRRARTLARRVRLGLGLVEEDVA